MKVSSSGAGPGSGSSITQRLPAIAATSNIDRENALLDEIEAGTKRIKTIVRTKCCGCDPPAWPFHVSVLTVY
jgi:hypothetical protein